MRVSVDSIRSLVTAGAVHRSVYTEQAIFDLEMERIFGKVWLYVAHESQLKSAGDFIRTRMGIQDVIVVRGRDGQIHVLKNQCPHRGATLCSAHSGHQASFTCPYHAWSFALDGTLTGLADKRSYPEDFRFDDPRNGLGRVSQVAIYRGFVFARLSGTGSSLQDFLGPMLSAIDNLVDRSPTGQLEVGEAGFRLEYRANWKMHHENANDTIHPGIVHGSSVSAARRNPDIDTGFDNGQTREMLEANGFSRKEWESIDQIALPNGHSYMAGIYRSGMLARKKEDPVRDAYTAAMIESYGEQRANEILNLDRFNNLVYPNLNVNAQYHQLRIVHPIAPDRTMVVSQCFRLIGAPERIYHRAVRFLTNLGSPASMIYGDDADIFERCNRGLTQTDGTLWINMERGLGMETQLDNGGLSGAPSEAPVRAQFKTWLDLMTAEETA